MLANQAEHEIIPEQVQGPNLPTLIYKTREAAGQLGRK